MIATLTITSKLIVLEQRGKHASDAEALNILSPGAH
jgi:hypothetical protein